MSSGIELVKHMGGSVVECACVVELKMFVNPPADSGFVFLLKAMELLFGLICFSLVFVFCIVVFFSGSLPNRTKMFASKGIGETPVWGLISEV